jgi:peptidoglycan/LPS O-acetylase OafA/YrhL
VEHSVLWIVFFVGFTAFTLISDYFTYTYFELPAQRLLRRIEIVVESG